MRRLKPSHLTIYILGAFLIFTILGIIAMQNAAIRDQGENQQLLEQIHQLEQENLEIEYRIADLGSDESTEQLARERLHWVYDQEIVYIDSGK